MPSRGILYAASNQDRYVEEAFLSAESLRRLNPGFPITLFTDRPDHSLCRAGVFDSVVAIGGVRGFKSEWAEGQLNRIACLARSPYDVTLHLDTDTRIYTSSFDDLFESHDAYDVAMVEEAADCSYSCARSGRRMFNAGFILFRKPDAAPSWLTAWEQRTRRNFEMALQVPLPSVPELAHVEDTELKRNLLRMDQISLMEILSPDRNTFGLKLNTLDPCWNYRGSRTHFCAPENVKIRHSTDFKRTTHADILSVAFLWDRAGRSAQADMLYDYVAGKQKHAQPRRFLRLWPRIHDPEEWATPSLRKADLHLRHGQPDKAAEIYGASIAADVGDPYALAGHARVALTVGRLPEAIGLAKEAATRAARSPYVLMVQGAVLNAAGRPQEAIAPLTYAAAKGRAGAAFQLGQVHTALEEYELAVAAFRRELARNAEHGGAANNLMLVLLGARRYGEALAVAEQNLAQRSWHVPALAAKAVALAELGRKEELAALVDLETFINVEHFAPPSGAFRDLAKVLREEKSLKFAPSGHATRQGWHSEDLSASATSNIQALNTAILERVEARIAATHGNDHPFLRARPQTYRLHTWTIVMDKGGRQIPHIHGRAWLSGVYYVELPDEVRENDSERKGWLSFGRAEERWHRDETWTPVREFCPRPGMLVTFPSYFWHGTRPVATSRRRISYAFDVIPG